MTERWAIRVIIDIDENAAHGDEVDLVHERIVEAFQPVPPIGGWGLDSVRVHVRAGKLVRRLSEFDHHTSD